MNAQEMFNRLGFYLSLIGTTDTIVYQQHLSHIRFWRDDRVYDTFGFDITPEIHQAITQQMKELGWL